VVGRVERITAQLQLKRAGKVETGQSAAASGRWGTVACVVGGVVGCGVVWGGEGR